MPFAIDRAGLRNRKMRVHPDTLPSFYIWRVTMQKLKMHRVRLMKPRKSSSGYGAFCWESTIRPPFAIKSGKRCTNLENLFFAIYELQRFKKWRKKDRKARRRLQKSSQMQAMPLTLGKGFRHRMLICFNVAPHTSSCWYISEVAFW